MPLTLAALNDAATDLGHIEALSTSPLPTATDRLGNEKMTVAGAVATIAAVNPRGSWASGTAYAPKDVVSSGGAWYICVQAHTSAASFATDAAKWRLYQGTIPSEVPFTVATYSALRNYAGDAFAVNVSGYLVTAAPAGIAGLFTRDDSDTTSSDNGGTIIVASNGKRWKRVFSGPAHVDWFGAKADTESASAIQAAITAHKVVAFSPVAYLQGSAITMQSGQVLHMNGALIKASGALTGAAWSATGADSITVYGGVFEGPGTAFSTGDEHLMLLAECTNARIWGSVFRKSRSEGLRLVNCSGCAVNAARAHNNYGTGLQDRDGSGNRWIGCDGVNNGDTGSATYYGGRGLLVWRSRNVQVIGGTFKGNTEYGLRVYSQVGDPAASAEVKIVGVHAEDNGKIDLFVYNEIGGLNRIHFSNCTLSRTTEPEAQPLALQGENISWEGGSIRKDGTRLSAHAVGLYDLKNSRVTGLQLENVGPAIAWSSSAPCENVVIEDWVADCAALGQLAGSNLTIRDNKLTHGGSGTTDIAIDVGSATGVIIDGNEFDGFYRNVSWTAQALTLRNNTSRNTTNVSLRMFGDGVAGLVSSGNNWDAGSEPIYVATAYRQANPNSRITVYDVGAPIANTWARGDRVTNRNPSVGAAKSWVCTVAGTPGTWVSEGNL